MITVDGLGRQTLAPKTSVLSEMHVYLVETAQGSKKSNLFKSSLMNFGLFWGHVIPLST